MRVLMVDLSAFSAPYDHCLCSALARRDCHVTLACGPTSEPSHVASTTYSVWSNFYPFTGSRRQGSLPPFLWRAARGADHLISLNRMLRQAEHLQPQVVHFQWLPAVALDRLFLPRLRRQARMILTLHNTTDFHGSPASRWQSLGLRQAVQMFDAVVVHSRFSQQQLVAKGWVPEDRITIVPHPILEQYTLQAAGDPLPAGEGVRRILFFGNLKPYKGLEVLIRAFATLPAELRAAVELVIAGPTAMPVAPLQELAAGLGVEDRTVWKLGFVPPDQVAPLFHSAAVVVLPYLEIDQSGVLMTAVAFNKPIIASRVGGFPEMLQHGVHGFLVEPGNAADLGSALARFLAQPASAEAMSCAVARLRTSALSPENVADRTLALYQAVLARPLV